MRTRLHRIATLVAVLAVGTGGCGSSSGGSPAAPDTSRTSAAATAPPGPADFPPADGEIVRRIKAKVGTAPSGVVTGFGSVWAVEHRSGRISRIDPDTGSIVKSWKIRGAIGHVEVAPTITRSGVVLCLLDGLGRIVRVDPATNRMTTARVNCETATSGPLGTWVVGDGKARRIDPATLAVLRSIPLPEDGGGQVVEADGSLWVQGFDGGDVYRIDPASGRTVKHWAFGRTGPTLATDGQRVFAANPDTDVVYALDSRTNQVARHRHTAGSDDGDPLLTYGLGALWLSTNNGGLARVNPRTLEITASVQLAATDYAGQLGTGFGAIWYPTFGGDTVLEVRPLD